MAQALTVPAHKEDTAVDLLAKAPDRSASLGAGTSAPTLTSEPLTASAEVRLFRERAMDNGYPLVRVKSSSKAPLPHDWQRGDRPELLLGVRPEALNTGLLLGCLRCVDCDVDDLQLASEITRLARQHLPPGALIRRRANSPRIALLYRSAQGQPSKRVAKGPKGKIEILGLGQQVVIHGVHPSGAAIGWQKGRGPDTVPHDQVPAVSEQQITEFLNACAPLLGANELEPTGASPRPNDALPSGFGKLSDRSKGLPVDNVLGAGITPHNWFSELPAKEQSDLVQACLNVLDNRISDPREVWLPVLFAVADAEQHGCPDARDLALNWSRRGRSWTNEHDFDVAWSSFKPGGISVGSLLARARDAGLDLSQWRDMALTQFRGVPVAVAGPATTQLAPALDPYSSMNIDPDKMPPHRLWSVGTKLIIGEVTVLAAKGGWGKSAYSIGIACSAASGRTSSTRKFGVAASASSASIARMTRTSSNVGLLQRRGITS